MHKKIFLILLVLIIISVYKLTDEYIYIPDSSIRLRVIPNSNNPEDINIKEQVKRYLENNIYSLTKNTKDIDEARIIISKNIPVVKENIDNIFTNNNYELPYEINFGYNYFPKKIYKGITYDEGYYESLVISIGASEGDNWWCVLFPPLCLLEAQKNDKVEYKFFIQELCESFV